MNTVRVLYEHCMSTEIPELNLSLDRNIGENELELKKSIAEVCCQTS